MMHFPWILTFVIPILAMEMLSEDVRRKYPELRPIRRQQVFKGPKTHHPSVLWTPQPPPEKGLERQQSMPSTIPETRKEEQRQKLQREKEEKSGPMGRKGNPLASKSEQRHTLPSQQHAGTQSDQQGQGNKARWFLPQRQNSSPLLEQEKMQTQRQTNASPAHKIDYASGGVILDHLSKQAKLARTKAEPWGKKESDHMKGAQKYLAGYPGHPSQDTLSYHERIDYKRKFTSAHLLSGSYRLKMERHEKEASQHAALAAKMEIAGVKFPGG